MKKEKKKKFEFNLIKKTKIKKENRKFFWVQNAME